MDELDIWQLIDNAELLIVGSLTGLLFTKTAYLTIKSLRRRDKILAHHKEVNNFLLESREFIAESDFVLSTPYGYNEALLKHYKRGVYFLNQKFHIPDYKKRIGDELSSIEEKIFNDIYNDSREELNKLKRIFGNNFKYRYSNIEAGLNNLSNVDIELNYMITGRLATYARRNGFEEEYKTLNEINEFYKKYLDLSKTKSKVSLFEEAPV